MSDNDSIHLSITVTPEVSQIINELAQEKNMSVTEFIALSITTEKFITDAMKRNDKLVLAKPDGKMWEVKFK